MSKDDKSKNDPKKQKPKVTRNDHKPTDKKVKTKRDPQVEIASWVDYQDQEKNEKKKPQKVSKSLDNLKKVRKKRIGLRIGIILVLTILVVGGTIYYFSPYSKVHSITVTGNGNIAGSDIIKTANIKKSDRILNVFLGSKTVDRKLKKQYPSIKSVSLSLNSPTDLKVSLTQYDAIGYLKKGDKYRLILHNGVVGKELFTLDKILSLPIYYGFKNNQEFQTTLKLIDKIPQKIKKDIVGVSQIGLEKSQIALKMKNGNYIFGSRETLIDKLKYYPEIAAQLSQPSMIDFEIGAFSRPISEKDKKLFAQ